jgi:hypothetical protein
MVITGKGFGQTNLIARDAAGSVIDEEQVQRCFCVAKY